jgi:hypothetical protein
MDQAAARPARKVYVSPVRTETRQVNQAPSSSLPRLSRNMTRTPISKDLAHMPLGELSCPSLTETARLPFKGITAQFAVGAVGYGEGMCCCAAMTTRTAA